MLARLLKAREENKEGGFTLIELLVVMIIIGILAAIAIPVFLSQRKKAGDTAAKSDAEVIGKDIAAYYVDGTSNLYLGVSGNTFGLYTTQAMTTASQVDSGNVTTADTPGGLSSATASATSSATAPTTAAGALVGVYSSTSGSGNFCVAVTNGNSNNTWWYGSTTGLVNGGTASTQNTHCTSAG